MSHIDIQDVVAHIKPEYVLPVDRQPSEKKRGGWVIAKTKEDEEVDVLNGKPPEREEVLNGEPPEPTFQPPPKKPKLTGMNKNKNRPKFARLPKREKLCRSVWCLRVGDNPKGLCSNPKCDFNHDPAVFIASKLPDLGSHCHNFNTFGFCSYGIMCRYGSEHIESGCNKVNEELWAKHKDSPSVVNSISKDLQLSLRKRTYDLSKALKTLRKVQSQINKMQVEAQKNQPHFKKPSRNSGASNKDMNVKEAQKESLKRMEGICSDDKKIDQVKEGETSKKEVEEKIEGKETKNFENDDDKMKFDPSDKNIDEVKEGKISKIEEKESKDSEICLQNDNEKEKLDSSDKVDGNKEEKESKMDGKEIKNSEDKEGSKMEVEQRMEEKESKESASISQNVEEKMVGLDSGDKKIDDEVEEEEGTKMEVEQSMEEKGHKESENVSQNSETKLPNDQEKLKLETGEKKIDEVKEREGINMEVEQSLEKKESKESENTLPQEEMKLETGDKNVDEVKEREGSKMEVESSEEPETNLHTVQKSSESVSLNKDMEKVATTKNKERVAEAKPLTPEQKGKEEKAVGPASDEDLIKLLSREKKKVTWNDQLYLAPLTTLGNLPFRRICKEFGADITCSEMAMASNLLQGNQSEWALVKRHKSETCYGIQLCGNNPEVMTKCSQLLEDIVDFDFIDINMGCPLDFVYKQGAGSALMRRVGCLEQMVRGMNACLTRPVTLKMRTAIYHNTRVAHSIINKAKLWDVSMVTVHGRSREQRYLKLADWDYIDACAKVAEPMPLFGNGDIFSFEDYNSFRKRSKVAGVMIGRGALVKPWIFKEIKEQQHWDISSGERLDMLKSFVNYGLEQWGSDTEGIEKTRRFLLEWLSFLHRYVPVGLLESTQRLNQRPPVYVGRNELETLMASRASSDWIKISEMLLGPTPYDFRFLPKHKANSY